MSVPLRQLEEASEFPYRPLDGREGHIRTLIILSDLKQGKVQCQLQHVEIGVSGYVCLSYTWGPRTSQHDILMDDRPVTVRDHLYSFLQTARQRIPGVNIWIDALSINQLDSGEKNDQVAQMGSIYRNADMVITWLGDLPQMDPILDFDQDTIAEYITRLEEDEEREESGDFEDPDHEPLLRDKPHEVLALFRALLQLKSHPYLERAWIYQEIAFARELLIWTVSGSIWRRVFGAIHMLLGDEYDSLEEVVEDDVTLKQEFGSDSMEESKTLQLLLHSHDGEDDLTDVVDWMVDPEVECEDPRDRVYAVRELVPSLNNFRVDYKEGLSSLFFRICNHLKFWWTGRDHRLLKHWNITFDILTSNDNLMATVPGNLGPPIIDRSWKKPNGAVLRCQLCRGALGSAQVCLSVYRQGVKEFQSRTTSQLTEGDFDFIVCLQSGDLSMPWDGHVYIGRGDDGYCTVHDGWWSVGTRTSIPSRNLVVLSELTNEVILCQESTTSSDSPPARRVRYPETDEEYAEMQGGQYRLIISKPDILRYLFPPSRLSTNHDADLNHDVEFKIKEEENFHRQLNELVSNDPIASAAWTLGRENREMTDPIHAHDRDV